MTKKKAISVLQKQKYKLEVPNIFVGGNDSWVMQTQTYLKAFFPPDSAEINKVWTIRLTNSEVPYVETYKKFLDDCIETIGNIGVHHPSKQNITEKLTNREIIYWAAAIGFGGFGIGVFIGRLLHVLNI